MPEPPLTDRELRILRGIIDDHEYKRVRSTIVNEWLHDGKTLAALIAGLVLVTLEIVQIVVALRP